MDVKTATEYAYKNGYRDCANAVLERIENDVNFVCGSPLLKELWNDIQIMKLKQGVEK